MKKILFLTLYIATILSCGSKKSENVTNDNAGPIYISTEDFCKKIDDINDKEWKYSGDKPAIVDFYADWCAPCRRLSPILDEIATEKADELYIYKVNVDNSPELASTFRISGIPALLFIPTDGTPSLFTGYMDKNELEELIKEKLLE